MKTKKFTTALTAAAVIFITGSFATAQTLATPIGGEFPYFLLGCLITGGLVITSLKRKFDRMYVTEAVGAFALYTLLVSLFTNPVIDAIKTIVS